MPMVTDSILQGLRTTVRGEFNLAFAEASAKSQWKRLATEIASSSASNVYGFLSKFPSMKKWIGERVVESMKEGSYELANNKYEATFGIERTDIEDDNLGQYKLISKTQAEEADAFFNREIAKLLKEGDKTLCYDNQNFFDKEHLVNKKVDGSGVNETVSNIFGAGSSEAWYLLSLDRALKPLILQSRTAVEIDNIFDTKNEHVFMLDKYLYGVRWRGAFGYGLWQQAMMSKETLDSTSFSEAYKTMRKFKRDGGDSMGVIPTTLVVSPDLQSAAESIINVASNASGAGNIHYKKVEIIVCDYL